MRNLIIVNLVFAGLYVICFWIFAFFTHGAFVHPAGLVVAGFIGWCVLIIMLPFLLIILFFNVCGIFKYWSEYKLKVLLPFLILGIAVMGLRFWDVRTMSIRRFEKYLPEYEAFVAKAEKEHKFGDWDVIPLPKDLQHLGYLAVAYDDEPNTLFVSFDVGNFGVFGHTAFLYSSNGEIARGTKASREWPRSQRVNEHWFRVSD